MMSESVAHDLAQTANSYPLTISLFGQLRIFVNGKPADPFRLNKSRALLAYLLVEGAPSYAPTWLPCSGPAIPRRRHWSAYAKR
ncbi:MAG: hypothetical protein R3E79_18250 [Caldilineaceae bacterium]